MSKVTAKSLAALIIMLACCAAVISAGFGNRAVHAANLEESKMRIPNSVRNFESHSYKVYETSKDWNQAKLSCESLGGHLVTITSKKEQIFVETLLKNGGRNCYWLGAERNSGGKFSEWVTGEKSVYMNFDTGEPNDSGGNEDALIFYRVPNPQLLRSTANAWNDIPKKGKQGSDPFFKTENIGFICEWDSVLPVGSERSNIGSIKDNSLREALNSVPKQLSVETGTKLGTKSHQNQLKPSRIENVSEGNEANADDGASLGDSIKAITGKPIEIPYKFNRLKKKRFFHAVNSNALWECKDAGLAKGVLLVVKRE